jgi:hypothetical protein
MEEDARRFGLGLTCGGVLITLLEPLKFEWIAVMTTTMTEVLGFQISASFHDTSCFCRYIQASSNRQSELQGGGLSAVRRNSEKALPFLFCSAIRNMPGADTVNLPVPPVPYAAAIL